jgi:Cu/Zn superoxide dismutase
MRKLLAVVLAICAVVAVPALAASSSSFKASMNGKSETPKSNSKATGSATFKIAANGKSISYTLKASKLTGPAQAAHIHFGKAGTAGPVIIAICAKPCSLPKSGKLTSKQFAKAPGVSNFAAAIKAIKSGKAYVNIHTKKHPAGEVRGQIKKG